VADRTVYNDGTATIVPTGVFGSDPSLLISGNGVWNNDAGAATIIQGVMGVFFPGPLAAFHNAGLLQETSTVFMFLRFPLSNAATGTIDVRAGTPALPAAAPFLTSGTVTIEARATFRTGDYVQTRGTTTVDGMLSLLAPSTVFLTGGLLTGRGTINGNVVNAAELQPGDSPGVLTINGNYTQTADGILEVEIGGPTVGSQYDRLAINGTASLAGTLNVIILNGFVPPTGTAFSVLTFRAHRGDFDVENGLDLGGGLSLAPVFASNDTGLSLVALQSG